MDEYALVKNSLLYRERQAEIDEIKRHKWYESEKAGHDIGFEHALVDWIVKHRSQWLKHYRKEHPLTPVHATKMSAYDISSRCK